MDHPVARTGSLLTDLTVSSVAAAGTLRVVDC